jgi:hypothetical protein
MKIANQKIHPYLFVKWTESETHVEISNMEINLLTIQGNVLKFALFIFLDFCSAEYPINKSLNLKCIEQVGLYTTNSINT